jgi:RNA polymerase sigma-70 factor (ECF subfamily)
LREKNRYKNLLDDYDERIVEVQEEEGEKENLQYSVKEVMEALFTLSDQYRLIMSLHLFEGYDYQEISQITKMKENTIRSIYMRGRIKLREELKNKRK